MLNANEWGIQEPSHGEVSVAEWDKERTGTAGLRKLRLLWTRRQLTLLE